MRLASIHDLCVLRWKCEDDDHIDNSCVPHRLATKMGYCTEPPKGVCSRAFVEGGSHNTNFDGVCFYPRWSLPGYAAIFR
jgi:hypothetical protein